MADSQPSGIDPKAFQAFLDRNQNQNQGFLKSLADLPAQANIGSLLGYIDSKTGSHTLPGYQQPQSPEQRIESGAKLQEGMQNSQLRALMQMAAVNQRAEGNKLTNETGIKKTNLKIKSNEGIAANKESGLNDRFNAATASKEDIAHMRDATSRAEAQGRFDLSRDIASGKITFKAAEDAMMNPVKNAVTGGLPPTPIPNSGTSLTTPPPPPSGDAGDPYRDAFQAWKKSQPQVK